VVNCKRFCWLQFSFFMDTKYVEKKWSTKKIGGTYDIAGKKWAKFGLLSLPICINTYQILQTKKVNFGQHSRNILKNTTTTHVRKPTWKRTNPPGDNLRCYYKLYKYKETWSTHQKNWSGHVPHLHSHYKQNWASALACSRSDRSVMTFSVWEQ